MTRVAPGRAWAIGLALATVLVAVAAWGAGSAMTRGHAGSVRPAVAPAQDFRLRAQDGLAIAATYRPGRSEGGPVVLMLHGVGASREATRANAEWLAGRGYAVLAIDFRGHGQSDMAPRSYGLSEALDARAAFEWLKRRQRGGRVAIIGISLGGAASLIGEDGLIPADALVLQAVYPDIRRAIRNRIAARAGYPAAVAIEPLLSLQALPRYGVWPSRLSPLAALPSYAGPVLIIGGEQDRSTPPEETRAMFAAAGGERALWMMPSGDHGQVSGSADPAYRARIHAFLKRTIG